MTDRKRQIMDAATTLFLEKGVGVSTASIAQKAGVSNGTLFNAFATKQLLIDAIYKQAKSEMFAAVPHCGADPLNRKSIRGNWDGYLAWAREKPEMRRVMHLLVDSGLASTQMQADVDAMFAPHVSWLQQALDDGIIRAPSVSFLGRLVFAQLDLVITENLDSAGEELAFEMLCTSIGLKQ